jgi:two-component system response regulator GlrR
MERSPRPIPEFRKESSGDSTPPGGNDEGTASVARVALFGRAGGSLGVLANALSARGWKVWIADETPGSVKELLASVPSVTCVLVQIEGPAPGWLTEALENRPADVPLVAVGALPESRMRPSCWVAEPSVAVLEGLLARYASTPVPAAGRRKSDAIIGTSQATQALLSSLDRIASSSAPVLITGESGTGKELIAKAVHAHSARAKQRMVAINCAAIPESLFEAELFGYNRGAFTGAVATRPGLFEAATGGTLFLDEIGEIPPSLQVKLLRVLETGEVARLGSNDSRQVDARLVAATNRDLESEIRAGRFREDLYYRLRVYPIHVLPLRERPDDIPPLTAHYLFQLAARERRPMTTLAPAALEKILGYDWPGNVRQLVAVLQRALLLATDRVIEAEHIDIPGTARPSALSYREAKLEFERRYYSQLMRTAEGKVSIAARLAEKTRKEVYDALRRHSLHPDSFRDGPDDER